MAKLATRHVCLYRYTGQARCPHTEGPGKPKLRKCRYCGGPFMILTGLWGVFEWTGDGRYPKASALWTGTSEHEAQAVADATSESAVVRWIPEEPAP
jgi:hypothetical protein